jgi:hypothetical protein
MTESDSDDITAMLARGEERKRLVQMIHDRQRYVEGICEDFDAEVRRLLADRRAQLDASYAVRICEVIDTLYGRVSDAEAELQAIRDELDERAVKEGGEG